MTEATRGKSPFKVSHMKWNTLNQKYLRSLLRLKDVMVAEAAAELEEEEEDTVVDPLPMVGLLNNKAGALLGLMISSVRVIVRMGTHMVGLMVILGMVPLNLTTRLLPIQLSSLLLPAQSLVLQLLLVLMVKRLLVLLTPKLDRIKWPRIHSGLNNIS